MQQARGRPGGRRQYNLADRLSGRLQSVKGAPWRDLPERRFHAEHGPFTAHPAPPFTIPNHEHP
ncbi:hypothetical protein [Kitasatospora sp. NPDC097691]|uniref:hypothetical protein n=1 Tax=Kitasatospora sp. NPDC097691 TaxID=3157231 RepID=UPI00332278AA